MATSVESDGTFVFPALSPGMHVFHVEGLPAWVTTTPGEIVVDVQAGRMAELDIDLQILSDIEVRVEWGERAGFAPPEREMLSLEGVRVELYDGQRLIGARWTRRDGTLQFPDLPAGVYRLTLDNSTLPRGARVAEFEQTIAVAEGERRVVRWTVQEALLVIEFGAVKPSAAFPHEPAAPKAGEPSRSSIALLSIC